MFRKQIVRMSMTKWIPNRWPDWCDRCEERVPVGHGFVLGNREIKCYQRYSGRIYYRYEDVIRCDKCVATEQHEGEKCGFEV